MPKVDIIFLRDEKGKAPLLSWLDELPEIIEAKARLAITRLSEVGYELKRPHSDYLKDGLYELRWK